MKEKLNDGQIAIVKRALARAAAAGKHVMYMQCDAVKKLGGEIPAAQAEPYAKSTPEENDPDAIKVAKLAKRSSIVCEMSVKVVGELLKVAERDS